MGVYLQLYGYRFVRLKGIEVCYLPGYVILCFCFIFAKFTVVPQICYIYTYCNYEFDSFDECFVLAR